MGKTYAIADLHGRHDLLCDALMCITKYSPVETGTIVTMGDYIDRGPQSCQVIDHLMRIQPLEYGWKMVCLKGNHEDMMVETITKPLHPYWWISNGGGRTLLSYGHPSSGDYHPEVVPKEHIDWIASLPLMHVDKHRVFVHAGVDPTIPLDEQTEQKQLWMLYPYGAEDGHGDRHVVHGHHQFEDGPKLFKGRTNLDTFAWSTGRLVIGVFDDDIPGGPVDLIEIKGQPAQ